MSEINLVQSMHASTKRDYVQRVVEHDKAESAAVARQWGFDYWDGERRFGYGGYHYDGRWRPLAQTLIERYSIKPGMRVLDVGCGKGYLLYEMLRIVPGLEIAGIDISRYGIENAKEETRPFLTVGNASDLPYSDYSFDLVVSLGVLHNLPLEDVWRAVSEIERVGRGTAKYVMVESFRDEREKANLLYWQLTCLSFHNPQTWAWIYDKCGYTGDHGFIFFE